MCWSWFKAVIQSHWGLVYLNFILIPNLHSFWIPAETCYFTRFYFCGALYHKFCPSKSLNMSKVLLCFQNLRHFNRNMLILLEEKWLQMLGLLQWVAIFSENLTQKFSLLYYFCYLKDNSIDMPKFIFELTDCVFNGHDDQNYLHCYYQEQISTTFLFLNSLTLVMPTMISE